VVGASIAGLMTARVLSEYFDQVVAIDRDEIEDRPVVHKSVPQGHHLHAFLQGGLNVVSLLYPSITEELRRLGATRIAMGRNAVWYTPNGKAYNFTGSAWRLIAPVVACLNLSFGGGRQQSQIFTLSMALRLQN
jgi:hypothetical protein